MIEIGLLESGINRIAGVDEAGRGACAGPLVIAAVVLREPRDSSLGGVADSKSLTAGKREELYSKIIESSLAYSIITIQPQEIDTKGLHNCNIEGMRRAITALEISPEYVLTDGYQIPGIPLPNLAIWKGDQVAISISSASIIAKVFRDRIMDELDALYPGYGLTSHKGYVTAAHTRALRELGVSEIHRKSYANIAALMRS